MVAKLLRDLGEVNVARGGGGEIEMLLNLARETRHCVFIKKRRERTSPLGFAICHISWTDARSISEPPGSCKRTSGISGGGVRSFGLTPEAEQLCQGLEIEKVIRLRAFRFPEVGNRRLFSISSIRYTVLIMSSSITKVAIAGFTGKMARRITSHLLQKPNVTIHGLCRNPSKVESSIASLPNVHLFAAASADSAALRTALAGTSVCICTYSGDDELMVDGQEALIDACIHEKVPRYVASDYCLDYRNLKLGDHPVKDAMKHVRSYLEEKEKRGDITGVHIINGAFTEYVWAPFLGWVNYEQERFEYYGTGEEKIQMATYDDVAKFTAEVALDPEASGFLNCRFISIKVFKSFRSLSFFLFYFWIFQEKHCLILTTLQSSEIVNPSRN